MRDLFISAISRSVEKEHRSCHHRWCHLQLLQHEARLHGSIKQNRMVTNYKGTPGPGVDSISCPLGQDFLGKCVPWTHYPGGQIFLRQLITTMTR